MTESNIQHISEYRTEKKSSFKKHAPKIIGAVLTAVVLMVLVFAGPADALSFKIQGLRGQYHQGQDIVFNSMIIVNTHEIVDIQNVTLKINNEDVCTFDVFGNPLTACEGIQVELVENTLDHGYGYGFDNFRKLNNRGDYKATEFGYGYGFSGTGKLKYQITITPQGQDYLNDPGRNSVKLTAFSDEQSFNSLPGAFVLRPSPLPNPHP